MNFFFTLLLFLTLINEGHSQEQKNQKRPVAYGGIGAGLDYGGFGMKAEFLPSKYLGIFAGAGFNLDGVGLNGGISTSLMPDKNTSVFLMVMYGYNGVIVLKSNFSGASSYHTYYGVSVGGGFDFKVGKNRNKVNLGIIVPFRSEEFDDDYERFSAGGYSFNIKPTNVLITVGFNVAGYNKKK